MEIIIRHTTGNPGAATFRGQLKSARSAGYDPLQSLSEELDEPIFHIKKWTGGRVLLKFIRHPTNPRQLWKIVIFDNIREGFKGVDKDGEEHPFCLITKNDTRHIDDDQWSQYGVGATKAAMAGFDTMEIVTRFLSVENTYKFAHIIREHVDMAHRDDFKGVEQPITAENYKKMHKYKTGSMVTLSGPTPMFKGDYIDLVSCEISMIARKYFRVLHNRRGHAMFQVDEDEPQVIKPDYPPTEDPNHPWVVFEYEIQIRSNANGEEKVLFKNTRTLDCLWHEEYSPHNGGKFRAIKKKEDLETLFESYPHVSETIKYKGTCTLGCRKLKEHCIYGAGTIVDRKDRILTPCHKEVIKNHTSFKRRTTSAEENYKQLMLTIEKKQTAAKLGATERKCLGMDGNLFKEDCELTRCLREVEKRLRADIGSASKFKDKFYEKYKYSYNDKKTAQENVDDGKKNLTTIRKRAEEKRKKQEAIAAAKLQKIQEKRDAIAAAKLQQEGADAQVAESSNSDTDSAAVELLEYHQEGYFVQADTNAHGSESDQDSPSETESVEDIDEKLIKLISDNRWKNELAANATKKVLYIKLLKYCADEDEHCPHGNKKGECPTMGCEN